MPILGAASVRSSMGSLWICVGCPLQRPCRRDDPFCSVHHLYHNSLLVDRHEVRIEQLDELASATGGMDLCNSATSLRSVAPLTCSLSTLTFIPAYRLYSSRIDDSAHRCSLRQHPTTVPVRWRPMLQHTSVGNVLGWRRRESAWMIRGSVGGGRGGRWSAVSCEVDDEGKASSSRPLMEMRSRQHMLPHPSHAPS